MDTRIKDLTGYRSGKLVATGFNRTENYRAYWNCRCDCGATSVVQGRYLFSKKTRSCGCDRKETNNRKTFTEDMDEVIRDFYPMHGSRACVAVINAMYGKELDINQVSSRARVLKVRLDAKARTFRKPNDKHINREPVMTQRDETNLIWLSSITPKAYICQPWGEATTTGHKILADPCYKR